MSGIDADGIVARIDGDEVLDEYERQRAEARSAAGTPAEAQGKTATSEGRVRFTAPSLVLRKGDETRIAGGWQPLLAYDVLLANLAPTLERTAPPESPEPLLGFFPDGLASAEVAQLLADGPDPNPELAAAARELRELEAAGRAVRRPIGRDAIWLSSRSLR